METEKLLKVNEFEKGNGMGEISRKDLKNQHGYGSTRDRNSRVIKENIICGLSEQNCLCWHSLWLVGRRKRTTLDRCIRFLISCGFCRGSISSLEHGGLLSLHNLDTFFFWNRLIFFFFSCVQILFAPVLLHWSYYAKGMQASKVTMVHFPLMTLSTGWRHFCGVMNSLGLPSCFLHMLWKLFLFPQELRLSTPVRASLLYIHCI